MIANRKYCKDLYKDRGTRWTGHSLQSCIIRKLRYEEHMYTRKDLLISSWRRFTTWSVDTQLGITLYIGAYAETNPLWN